MAGTRIGWHCSRTGWPGAKTAWPGTRTVWHGTRTGWPGTRTGWPGTRTGWHSTRTGWPGTNTLFLGETAGLIGSLCRCVAARKTIQSNPSPNVGQASPWQPDVHATRKLYLMDGAMHSSTCYHSGTEVVDPLAV